jgi:cytochrome c peroxidase
MFSSLLLWRVPILCILSSAFLSGCGSDQSETRFQQFQKALGSPSLLNTGSDTTHANDAHRPLPSVQQLIVNADKVALGDQLFHDGKLSKDGTVACAFCHVVARGGVDGLPVSIGVGGANGGINAPTVLNSGFNFRQFWDGRAATLADQAKGPPENPIEMAHKWSDIVQALKADAAYQQKFTRIYSEGITVDTVVDAIAEFEKTLITPNAPYDRYLAGDKTAMKPEAIHGLKLFSDYGCISCHQGINVGGNLYQKMGALVAYFDEKNKPTAADQGLAGRSKRVEDQNVFKVPSLRNVALTAPYFHNAAAPNLTEAVRIMSANQLGRVMPDNEIADIVAFLESLTGETPKIAAGK